jgi:hypothetical protein
MQDRREVWARTIIVVGFLFGVMIPKAISKPQQVLSFVSTCDAVCLQGRAECTDKCRNYPQGASCTCTCSAYSANGSNGDCVVGCDYGTGVQGFCP